MEKLTAIYLCDLNNCTYLKMGKIRKLFNHLEIWLLLGGFMAIILKILVEYLVETYK